MKHYLILLTAIILAGAVVITARAAPANIYSIDWYSIGSSNLSSSGGSYSLMGSAGEWRAGTLQTAPYQLLGGFWAGINMKYSVYRPVILR